MNISNAIKQGYEECVGEERKVPLKTDGAHPRNIGYAEGYNIKRNHVKEHYPKALEAVIESLEEWIKENTYTEIHKSTNWGMESEVQVVYTSDVLDQLNQAKETLQELNQK